MACDPSFGERFVDPVTDERLVVLRTAKTGQWSLTYVHFVYERGATVITCSLERFRQRFRLVA